MEIFFENDLFIVSSLVPVSMVTRRSILLTSFLSQLVKY